VENKSGICAVSDEEKKILGKAGTGIVADALLMVGFEGGVEGIHPARGFEDVPLVGSACTVRFGVPDSDTPKLTTYGVIEHFPSGSILVMDAQGSPNHHYAGDNVGFYAKSRGLAGVVLFGGARDVAGWRKAGMPLYCTGLATKDKPAGTKVVGSQIPVEIGGVLVKPGDIIVGDEDGIVVVPREYLKATIEKIQIVSEVEADMRQAIEGGATGAEISEIVSRKKSK